MKDPSTGSWLSIPLRCRFHWHWWQRWEDAGIAIHPGHTYALYRGLFFLTQRRFCTGCSQQQQRYVGVALQSELVEAGNANAKIIGR